MYRKIATRISRNFPAQDFLTVNEIYFKSNIETYVKTKTQGTVTYNFKTEIKNYTADTFFIGHGTYQKWISLNIIEGSDELFIHTSLQPTQNTPVDVTSNYSKQGFNNNRNCHLYSVGKLTDPIQNLLTNVNTIVSTLK